MNIRNINAQNRTAAIGVSFDVPNEREVIAIGSPENLKSYFTMGILSDEIDVRTRKLGSFVEDMNELAKGDCDSRMDIMAECSNGLCGIISEGQGNKSAEEYKNALTEIYDDSGKGNMILNFMIFSILTNYEYNHKTLSAEWHLLISAMKKSAARFAEQFNTCVSDMLLPFRNLPTLDDSNVRYWNIPEQLNDAPTDLTIHVYYTHNNGTWQTVYVAEDSFLAILRIYCDILKQSNRIISNCPICRKLIVKSKQTESDFCSEECRLANKNEWTKENRARNAKSGVQTTYDIFYTTGNNLKRKLKKDPSKLAEFDEHFKNIRKKALVLKNSISDDSPDSELREYKQQIRRITDELVNFADELNDRIKDDMDRAKSKHNQHSNQTIDPTNRKV